jgi:hypothetical protein
MGQPNQMGPDEECDIVEERASRPTAQGSSGEWEGETDHWAQERLKPALVGDSAHNVGRSPEKGGRDRTGAASIAC